MRWCIGYLSKDEAIAFLKKAKDHLYKKPIESTRSHFPSSYIIVIDNVLEPGKKEKIKRGQTIRTKKQLTKIFG